MYWDFMLYVQSEKKKAGTNSRHPSSQSIRWYRKIIAKSATKTQDSFRPCTSGIAAKSFITNRERFLRHLEPIDFLAR
jgi:hypothetical protein